MRLLAELIGCWWVYQNYSALSGLNAFGTILFKGLHPLLAIPPRWG